MRKGSRLYYRLMWACLICIIFAQPSFAEDPPLKNVFSIDSYPAFVSDRNNTWFYNNMTYGRITPKGSYFIELNESSRNGHGGFQTTIKGYPKVNKQLYFYADYSYSDSFLYPKDIATLRANFILPSELEFAPGGQYFKIARLELWSYSFWISKYFGNHWLSLQPLIYKPQNGSDHLYVKLNYRYYFSLPNHYLSLSIASGKTPDLLDLTSTGFVMIRQWDFFSTYNFPIGKNVYLYFGGGYVRQDYPSGLIRKITMLLIGLKTFF